jgi:uncharacterized cupin superfamily protein
LLTHVTATIRAAVPSAAQTAPSETPDAATEKEPTVGAGMKEFVRSLGPAARTPSPPRTRGAPPSSPHTGGASAEAGAGSLSGTVAMAAGAAEHAAPGIAGGMPSCERCPQPGQQQLCVGAYVEVTDCDGRVEVVCAQCYEASGKAAAAGSKVAHFAVERGPERSHVRAAVDVPRAEYAATTEDKIERKLSEWVDLWRESSAKETDLLSGRLQLSFPTAPNTMPPGDHGFLPASMKHLAKTEHKRSYARAKKLYMDTRDLVHELLGEDEMQRRVQGLFDKMKPGARNPRGRLHKGAIEIVVAVGEAPPQWPHVDVLTSGKLQVLVYLNGVEIATQLARYDGDPVAWAERAYTADGNGNGVGRDASWEEQAGELAELAAVTAEFGTERVVVTSAVKGRVRAGTVQAIANRDAVHFGPRSTGLRFLLVFVVAASETDMDEQDVPLQRAGPDALGELGLVAQLVLPRVRAEMSDSFFKRRRGGLQAEFAKERWPDRVTNRPMFSPTQWDRVIRTADPAQQTWGAFRDQLRLAAAAHRCRLTLPRHPHPLVRIIPVGAQKEHLTTMDGVDLQRLREGTYNNGDAFAPWSSEKTERVFAHTFPEGEVGRVDGGLATITPTDGDPFIIGVGDVVHFGAGFSCTFTVHEHPLTKTLAYLTAEGEIDYDTTSITCDKCDNQLRANVPWYRQVADREEPAGKKALEDWCEKCFREVTDPRYFVKQVRGTPQGYQVKPGVRSRGNAPKPEGGKGKKQLAKMGSGATNSASRRRGQKRSREVEGE